MKALATAFVLALALPARAQEHEAPAQQEAAPHQEVPAHQAVPAPQEAAPHQEVPAQHGAPAQHDAPSHQEAAAQHDAPAHQEAPQGHHTAHHGIVNWWSWDHGPNAKDPSHKHWPAPFGFALVNFGVFLVIMARLAGRPLKSFVRDRHDRIKKDLEEAAHLRGLAEKQLAEYAQKVKNVESEIEALLKDIRKEAEVDKARIIAAAEAQAAHVKADAQRQIDAEIERARSELRRAVVEAAVDAAGALVRTHIGADDQRKMAEQYVGHVEAGTRRPS